MNRKFRAAAFAAVAALSLTLAGCGSSSSGSSQGAASTSPSLTGGSSTGTGTTGKLTVGFVGVNLNSPSITAIKDSFVKAAEAKGWKVDVFDGQGDQNATNNQAMQYLNQGVNVLVNDSSPNDQMTDVINAANAKHVPFVSIYGGGNVPGVAAEIGTNEFVNSALITQEMVNRLGGQGNVLKLNWSVLQALKDRDAGYDAVASQNPNIHTTVLGIKVPGQVDDAYNKVTTYLQSHKDVNAIWIGWDELAPPVVRAIQQANMTKQIFVVGFDGNPFAWDLIRSGTPYVMEPANPFPPMGTKAVDVISTLASGGTLPSKVIYMKPCLMTAQTVPAAGQQPDWQSCPFFPGDVK